VTKFHKRQQTLNYQTKDDDGYTLNARMYVCVCVCVCNETDTF